MGNLLASSELGREVSLPRSPTAPSELTERYFVLQGQRPERLRDVELSAMDPALRALLFTDGTVTRTLEAQALSKVTVEVVAQTTSHALGLIARHLDAPPDTEAVRRRVTIGIEALDAPLIWAESYLLSERLPTGFIRLLDDTPDGIGESLQQIKLEGWREMLWFGLDSPPSWDEAASAVAPAFLTRLYRVVTRGQPALLISESFAVEQSSGRYRLVLDG